MLPPVNRFETSDRSVGCAGVPASLGWCSCTVADRTPTWDTVILGLDESAVALDLPGHGRSRGGRTVTTGPS